MTIQSYGYNGSLNEQAWALMARHAGSSYAVQGQRDFEVSPVAGQDRTVSIAAGSAYGHGVLAVSDAPITVQLEPVTSGSRWDLVALYRDWRPPNGGVSAVVVRKGTSTQALPTTRLATPGSEDDQPLALVQVTAGFTTPTAILNLRVFPSKVLAADSLIAVPSPLLGTEVVVGRKRYRRVLDSSGNPAWDDDDTDWVTGTSGWVPKPGWDYTGLVFRYRIAGDVCQVYGGGIRKAASTSAGVTSGGPIEVPGHGDIPNVPLVGLPPAITSRGVSRGGGTLTTGNTGRLASFWVGGDGVVNLTAFAGGADFVPGNQVSFGGTFLLG